MSIKAPSAIPPGSTGEASLTEKASIELGNLATSLLLTFLVIIAFAILTALVSQAIIDLVLRRLLFARTFRSWWAEVAAAFDDLEVSRLEVGRGALPQVPGAAYNLSTERFCALVSNRLRANLERTYRGYVKGEAEAKTVLEERAGMLAVDRTVDDLQAMLINTTRRMRYGTSLIVALVLLAGAARILGSGTDAAMTYLIALSLPVAILASWIQSLELRAIRVT